MRCTLATCACSRASCARRWNKRAALLLAPPQTLARACTRPSLGTCTTLCRSHAPARALARVHAARARVRNCLCLRRRKQMRLVASCQLGRDFCLGIARAADAAPVAAQQTHQTTDQPMIIFAPVVSTILHRVPAQSMRWFAYIPIPHTYKSTDSHTLGYLNVYSLSKTSLSHPGKSSFNKSSSEMSSIIISCTSSGSAGAEAGVLGGEAGADAGALGGEAGAVTFINAFIASRCCVAA